MTRQTEDLRLRIEKPRSAVRHKNDFIDNRALAPDTSS